MLVDVEDITKCDLKLDIRGQDLSVIGEYFVTVSATDSGGNRVSLSVVLFQKGNGPINLSAISTGGSQALFFKINTWGEEAFLDKLREIL